MLTTILLVLGGIALVAFLLWFAAEHPFLYWLWVFLTLSDGE